MRGKEYYDDDDEFIIEEAVDKLRGTIAYGDCIYCGAHHAMKYEGDICFVCDKCGRSIYEDLYYRWAAGYEVEMDEDEL